MTQQISELEYLKLTGWQKFSYKFVMFFKGLPRAFLNFFTLAIPCFFKKIWNVIKGWGLTIGGAAKHGDWKTRTSFVVFGFSQLARKQWLRGILYLVFELLFILYMALFGGQYLGLFGSLGKVQRGEVEDPETGLWTYTDGDNSLLILLYGILTIAFIVCFVYAWYKNIKSSYIAQQIEEAGQSLATAKQDMASLLNEQYHKTLLGIPLAGLTIFTIIPIIFMVFLAFTNYDQEHLPPTQLFTWIGWDNFKLVFGGDVSGAASFGYTFAQVLLWTVLWAFFATFSNYILGMVVAIIINKKGVRFKKLWRTILVMTIAVPQFVSLLLMSQMLGTEGAFNKILMSWGWIDSPIPFLTDATLAKVSIILVNIWIGIPYTMLMTTGILMNIPEDLYESARIDGAGPVKAFFKITLPYMLHVTAPYLITQFIGNLNNFNVIYLLTGGAPLTLDFAGNAGRTDLLITWLYKLVMDKQLYGMASVISILMFIITAVVSLITYNRSSSVKNEEDFM